MRNRSVAGSILEGLALNRVNESNITLNEGALTKEDCLKLVYGDIKKLDAIDKVELKRNVQTILDNGVDELSSPRSIKDKDYIFLYSTAPGASINDIEYSIQSLRDYLERVYSFLLGKLKVNRVSSPPVYGRQLYSSISYRSGFRPTKQWRSLVEYINNIALIRYEVSTDITTIESFVDDYIMNSIDYDDVDRNIRMLLRDLGYSKDVDIEDNGMYSRRIDIFSNEGVFSSIVELRKAIKYYSKKYADIFTIDLKSGIHKFGRGFYRFIIKVNDVRYKV